MCVTGAPISHARNCRAKLRFAFEPYRQLSMLSEMGLIEEIGTGDSTGGRKPTLLKLRTDSPCAVGVDLTPRETTVAVADLAGKIVEMEKFATSPDADYMSGQIIERVAKFAGKYNSNKLEVGMSLPES